MAAKRKAPGKAPVTLTHEQRRHRQFKRALVGYGFNSAVIAGLAPFTQQHGRGAVQALPNFDYAAKHYPLVVNRPDGVTVVMPPSGKMGGAHV